MGDNTVYKISKDADLDKKKLLGQMISSFF
jgi:hypothetical protein